MSRDLELLEKYSRHSAQYKYINDFLMNVISYYKDDADNNKILEIINLDVLRESINELIDFFIVLKRWRALCKEVNNSTSPISQVFIMMDYRAFSICGYEVETLDEAEKIWKNKAFL